MSLLYVIFRTSAVQIGLAFSSDLFSIISAFLRIVYLGVCDVSASDLGKQMEFPGCLDNEMRN